MSDDTARLRAQFQEYVAYNRRDLEELRKKTLRKLMFELNKQAKEVAPTKEEIAAKVESLGGRLVKKGDREQWEKLAYKQQKGPSMRKMTKEERRAEKDRRWTAVAQTNELKLMQAFVIKKRAARIGFMANGYAIAARLLGFNIGSKSVKNSAHGEAADNGKTTTIAVTAGGINDVDARTQFTSKAINNTIADMQKYIDQRIAAGRERMLR